MSSAPAKFSVRGAASAESNAPPATMAAMPAKTRRSTFSRKSVHAIAAVSTASRLSSREAEDASLRASPCTRRIGPATPPAAMAAASQGQSVRAIGATGSRPGRASAHASHAASPRPLPRYSAAASTRGDTSPSRSFANGVLAPNSAAAASALAMPPRSATSAFGHGRACETRTPILRALG